MNEVELKVALKKVDHDIKISRYGLKKLLDERIYIIEELKRIDNETYASTLKSEAAYRLEEARRLYVHACMKINADLDEDLNHA